MNKLLKNIIALCTLGSIMFGTFFFLDARHASTESVVAIEKRLTIAELKRILREAEEDYFYYKKLNRKYPADEEIKRKLDEAAERVRDLKERIKKREEK